MAGPQNALATYVVTPAGKALGYDQITSLGSAVGLTPPSGALVAVIVAEGAAVRWRDDGTAPTATVGMPLPAGGQMTYAGDLGAIQFIEQADGAALDVSYYG
jgi:hypothetical protein